MCVVGLTLVFCHCRYISLPQPEELHQMVVPQHDPQQTNHHYCVILYIDGCIVGIQRPDHAGDAFFCGRHGKSCDFLNVPYITDKWGRICHIITGLSGSTHDKTAAAWLLRLRQFLDALPDGYVVLGDAAYRGLHARVITPLVGSNLTAEQQAYNNACTRMCQIVERSIGASELK